MQQYLLHEIQNVYRSQRVEIDDKHIEIVVSQMLRKLASKKWATSTMLPGVVIDKFEFRKANEQLIECVKIADPGNTEFQIGDIVPGSTLEEVNAQVEAADQKPAKRLVQRPRPPALSCWASPRRPCRAKASSRQPASRKRPRC